jgi:MFS family permease
MFQKARQLYNEYPSQYWLMITGVVISTAGGSMIWPFLLIYASAKLNLPLSTVATLISINAGTGLLSSFLAGTLADKIGRKVVMNFSLTLTGIAYFFLMRAETYPQFVVLMILIGLSNPLYQVGADAMLADIIPSEKRTDAYAISRIANNAAFALGPAVGGFLAATSYNLAFYGAATGYIVYSLLLFFLAHETLEKLKVPISQMESEQVSPKGERSRMGQEGYARVFQDKGYMLFPSILWILMPVYAKTNFGIPENLYGWIPTTNALMCVFIQYAVTLVSRRHKTLPVVAIGMLIYAAGAGSVALMSSFWGFWLSMVILTFGELVVVPTASNMGVYWLGWGLARTLAPLIGGFLNDAIAPRAIWIGGLIIGLTSVTGLTVLSRFSRSQSTIQADV